MSDMYCQCRMVRRLSPTSTTEQVAYIPQKFAVGGRELRLRENGEWTEGWVVECAGEPVPREQVDTLYRARKQLGSLEVNNAG